MFFAQAFPKDVRRRLPCLSGAVQTLEPIQSSYPTCASLRDKEMGVSPMDTWAYTGLHFEPFVGI